MDGKINVLPTDFLIIDTEGKDLLRELAVLDPEGNLVYQAWVAEHPDNDARLIYTQPLKQVMLTLIDLTRHRSMVCHHAQHDRQILRQACRRANIRPPNWRFICTWKLAQRTFPGFTSYSLAYLSRKLQLKVYHQRFNPRQAHSARYDAEFTYQLYRTILTMQPSSLFSELQSQSNPFTSNRVDTPFQDHPDQKQIYQLEFEQLKATIAEIRQDANHQSRGAVVIGEPGSGKTHLMMRLAKDLLPVHRLLFIRHPNNPDAILYHIYSRILESLIEMIPGTNYTQLEHFLAYSFVRLIQTSRIPHPVRNDQAILTAVQDSPLNLYRLAAEDTDRKRALWRHIEKRTQEWWGIEQGFAGYAPQILKGMIKFCSYSDPRRKNIVARWLAANSLNAEDLEWVGLEDWQEGLSKEEFSLEAIAVFSKLSRLDEPLLIVFDQLESLGLPHQEKLLLNFGEAVKELFTHVPNSLIILNLFPDRWQQFQQVFSAAVVDRISQTQIYLHPPAPEALQQILQLKVAPLKIELTDLFTPEDLAIILQQPSIRATLNVAAQYFRYRIQGLPLPPSPVETLTDSGATTQLTPLSVTQRLDRLESGFAKLQQVFHQLTQVWEGGEPQSPDRNHPSLSSEDVSQASPTSPVVPPSLRPLLAPQVTQPSLASLASFPLADDLDRRRLLLRQDYQKPQIITDSDDLGKLTTIAEAFKLIKPFTIDYLRLGKRTLPEHLMLVGRRKVAIGFLQIDGGAFTSRLKNWNELVVTDRTIHYQLWRDGRLSEIRGKVGRDEVEKLNYSHHGAFLIMDEEQRLDFELIYRLIVDVQNRDLEIDLPAALQTITEKLSDSWLCQLFQAL
ncbi:MAG: exonuclease domain-containing protein [Elainella sp. Prado103]|nr:exonuclease domain-containing protein [Elainella sp. Prado103]